MHLIYWLEMKVDLTNQNFENIRIQNTSLFGGNFAKCNLTRSQFDNVNINGVNLCGAQLFDCNWKQLKINDLYSLDGHSNTVQSVFFSPDGNTLASGSSDKSIRLWDVKTGQQKDVQQVCFSPDGNTLVSGSSDNSIRLWEIKKKYCSDQRFKEIQVKNTRYPFFNTPLQYIQYYGLPRLQFFKVQESFLQKTVSFQENYWSKSQFLTITIDQFKNQPILTLNLNLFQYTSCVQYFLIEFYFIVFFFFNNLEALLKWKLIQHILKYYEIELLVV
ncbi:unnamed protein product [Paramecium pentaurelia]|uniref:Uncharacterized protein n=1 Tax=Paramecium pentaurelia TaxID=43138 RepID=A0A8S1WJZ8_9CILI|nr:unnamed protein product [Paramecium pentaurelia]